MTTATKIKQKSQKKEPQGPESVFADIIDKMATPGSYKPHQLYKSEQLSYNLRNQRLAEKSYNPRIKKNLQPSK